MASTYYVSSSGNNANTGLSIAQAFRDFTPFDTGTGSVALVASDKIILMDTIHHPEVTDIDLAGKENITIQGRRVNNNNPEVLCDSAFLQFEGAVNFTFRDIDITCSTGTSTLLRFGAGGAGNVLTMGTKVLNCDLSGGGIVANHDDVFDIASTNPAVNETTGEIDIMNCKIHDTGDGEDGITTFWFHKVTIAHCEIYNIGGDATGSVGNDGIALHTGGLNQNRVYSNKVYSVYGKSAISFGGWLGTGGYCYNNMVWDFRPNTVHDATGITFTGTVNANPIGAALQYDSLRATRSVIANNLVVMPVDADYGTYGIQVENNRQAWILFNTIIGQDVDSGVDTDHDNAPAMVRSGSGTVVEAQAQVWCYGNIFQNSTNMAIYRRQQGTGTIGPGGGRSSTGDGTWNSTNLKTVNNYIDVLGGGTTYSGASDYNLMAVETFGDADISASVVNLSTWTGSHTGTEASSSTESLSLSVSRLPPRKPEDLAPSAEPSVAVPATTNATLLATILKDDSVLKDVFGTSRRSVSSDEWTPGAVLGLKVGTSQAKTLIAHANYLFALAELGLFDDAQRIRQPTDDVVDFID